jgi:hypothetical protein
MSRLPIAIPSSLLSSRVVRSAGALAGLLAGNLLNGQVTVTGVTYSSVVNTADVTVQNVTYQNQYYAVQNIATSSAGNYQLTGPQASNVFFRRNASNGPNNSTVIYQYSDFETQGTDTVQAYGTGDSSPTLSELMMSQDLTKGIRNPFANGTTSDSSNIERIDFYLPNYTVQANDALVFFDLENLNNFGDGFRIAAYTAVDGSATPTTYASTGLLIGADSFGPAITPPVTSDARYVRSTTTAGDNLNSAQTFKAIDSSAGNGLNNDDLYLVGILIRFSDLGIAAGTTIQGFSLMAGDVTPTNAASLVNWNNTSVYRNNTSADGYGNMDFMAFGSRIARPVPEPSTYGAIFMGVAVAGWLVRRKLTAKAA